MAGGEAEAGARARAGPGEAAQETGEKEAMVGAGQGGGGHEWRSRFGRPVGVDEGKARLGQVEPYFPSKIITDKRHRILIRLVNVYVQCTSIIITRCIE